MNSTLKCVCRSDFPSQSTHPLSSPTLCVCEWGRCIQSDRWNAFRFGHFDTFHVELEQHAHSCDFLLFLSFVRTIAYEMLISCFFFVAITLEMSIVFSCHCLNRRIFSFSPFFSISNHYYSLSLVSKWFGIFLCTRNKYTYLIRIW